MIDALKGLPKPHPDMDKCECWICKWCGYPEHTHYGDREDMQHMPEANSCMDSWHSRIHGLGSDPCRSCGMYVKHDILSMIRRVGQENSPTFEGNK